MNPLDQLSMIPVIWVTKKRYSDLIGDSLPTIDGYIRDEYWTEGVEFVKTERGKVKVNIIAAQQREIQACTDKAEKEVQSQSPEENWLSAFGGEAQRIATPNIAGQSRHMRPILRAIDKS